MKKITVCTSALALMTLLATPVLTAAPNQWLDAPLITPLDGQNSPPIPNLPPNRPPVPAQTGRITPVPLAHPSAK